MTFRGSFLGTLRKILGVSGDFESFQMVSGVLREIYGYLRGVQSDIG